MEIRKTAPTGWQGGGGANNKEPLEQRYSNPLEVHTCSTHIHTRCTNIVNISTLNSEQPPCRYHVGLQHCYKNHIQ